MFTLQKIRKILGKKADGLTDEQIETMRDEFYVGANLAFSHWQEGCASAKEDGEPSPFAGVQPTSNQLLR